MPESQESPRWDEQSSSTNPSLGQIIDRLWQEGYTVVGPTIAQGAIIFDEVRGLEQLPIGWTDEQEGGTYRLKRRDDEAYFGYAVGPHSWKKYLFPSRSTLFSIEHDRRIPSRLHPVRSRFPSTRSWVPARATCTPSRFRIGCSCRDPMSIRIIKLAREPAFIIAVNCAQAAATCFCTSMKTGPEGRLAASTWRSPSCRTCSSSRWPPTAAAR